MDIPQVLKDVLKQDGVVAIATQGAEGPHLANTWHSYVRLTEDGRLLVPAGGLHRTEANLARDGRVLVTLGSSQVPGLHGPGTGFLIEGTAQFIASGPDFEATRSRFGWARGTVAILPRSITRTL